MKFKKKQASRLKILFFVLVATVFTMQPMTVLAISEEELHEWNLTTYDPTDQGGNCLSTTTSNPDGTDVVLDPGHSGTDKQGKEIDPITKLYIGDSSNTPEKDQVWDTSERIKKILEDKGYTVAVTKKSANDYQNFRQRANFANNKKAQIVVSLHNTPGRFGSADTGWVTPQKLGGYRTNTEGKKISFDNSDIASKSQSYAEKILEERKKAEGGVQMHDLDFQNRSGLSPGNLSVVQLLATVPWVYNEVGQTGYSSEKYAQGVANGIMAAIKPRTGSTTTNSVTSNSTSIDTTGGTQMGISVYGGEFKGGSWEIANISQAYLIRVTKETSEDELGGKLRKSLQSASTDRLTQLYRSKSQASDLADDNGFDNGRDYEGKRADGSLHNVPGFATLSSGPLTNMKVGQKIAITYKGKTAVIMKVDIGGGGGKVNGVPRGVDLWWEVARYLDFKNGLDVATFKEVPDDTPLTNVATGVTPATDGCDESASGAAMGDAIATAINYAWPEYHPPNYFKMKPEYAAAVKNAQKAGKYVGGGKNPGIDCGGFVTRVMQDSGVDPEYGGGGNTISQMKHMASSGKYERIHPKSTADMKPGDIAVNSDHTYIYVGTNPGFKGSVASSSYSTSGSSWRAPMAGNEAPADPSYQWYRLKIEASKSGQVNAGDKI